MLNKCRLIFLQALYLINRRFIISFLKIFSPDLEKSIIVGDLILFWIMKTPFKYFFKFHIPKNISTKVFNLNFPSPVIAASFKDHSSSLYFWQLIGVGAVTYKTLLKEPSKGNLRPRVVEVKIDGKKHLINSLGLPNKGIDHFINTKVIENIIYQNRPIGISIGGNSDEEYLQSLKTIEQLIENKNYRNIFYEINVSCPNTVHGKTLNDNCERLINLLSSFQLITSRPIFVKVAPDTSNDFFLKLGNFLNMQNNLGINIGNTKSQSVENLNLSSSIFRHESGGLSGPVLYNSTLESVKFLSSRFNFPIIATGGASDYDSVKNLLKNGASLVGMAAQLVFNPFEIAKINRDLSNEV